ncbi:Protein of unknown function [Bacillus wiedmannii]|uniref:Uncharacterized protein n=1 Tax=Bacillus wiedmannii TaxID=1890302 RepID=A0A1C4G085_9BACI|nr:Protein of unknown function [Bacillus wiedmannii]
MSGNGQNPIN